MNDQSAIARFGSGREVKRIEDAGLLAGAGRFADDVALDGADPSALPALAACPCRASSRSTPPRRGDARRDRGLTGADLVAAGVKPMPLAPIFQRPDGSPGATPLRPALARRRRPLRRRGGRRRGRRDAEQAKDALEAIAVEYEELPVVTGAAQATAAGRAAGLAGRDRQHRRADAARRRRGD